MARSNQGKTSVKARRAWERALNAYVRGSHWLAEGNVARDAGNKKRAEQCYAKAQVWLDRYNQLTGCGPQ